MIKFFLNNQEKMSSNERLNSQIIDILVYDFNIKYHELKNNGLNKEQINNHMEQYQKSRIQIFKEDLNRIKKFKK
jgi:hypothetical protein